ncbi:hypothetical protein PYW08_009714 [Mythimna loreyi]|uniref:Uncharacterized protein n=1 Tax=Mythimna loreyi TaxID=667449 RepID=A0ACC2QBN1_9NEOP|nr:hypothetical protein PYW08_009714 [Mythimna loreyi]
MGINKYAAKEKHLIMHHVPKRILLLSEPKKVFAYSEQDLPKYTKSGIRQSALRGRLHNSDIAWPYLRRLIALKRMYKHKLSQERLQIIDRMIEASNATMYSKLASCAIDLKRAETAKDMKKKKSWSSSEWKKHTEYLAQIANPKKVFKPPPHDRGKAVPLDVLLPRLQVISTRPDFKCYKKITDEEWYRDPEKVSPKALKYQASERTKKLAVARVVHTDY